jgi:hypothetical protein
LNVDLVPIVIDEAIGVAVNRTEEVVGLVGPS